MSPNSRGRFFVNGWASELGREVKFFFWVDDWLGVGLLFQLFPRIFKVMSNKKSSIKDCYEGGRGFVSWEVSFRRVLGPYEES